MFLIFFNIALWSAIVYYIARTVRKSFEAEVRYIIGLFRDPKLPPGPLGVPFFGSLTSVAGTDSYTAFSQLAKRYGGQVFLQLGKKKIFIMREPDMIREAYRQTSFSDRPKTSFKDKDLIGNKGKKFIYVPTFLGSPYSGASTAYSFGPSQIWKPHPNMLALIRLGFSRGGRRCYRHFLLKDSILNIMRLI